MQFRIAGPVKAISDSEDDDRDLARRRGAWKNLSDTTKRQFYWPPSLQTRSSKSRFAAAGTDTEHVLESFCLCLLFPESVDMLRVDQWPHGRTLLIRERPEVWTRSEVNP